MIRWPCWLLYHVLCGVHWPLRQLDALFWWARGHTSYAYGFGKWRPRKPEKTEQRRRLICISHGPAPWGFHNHPSRERLFMADRRSHPSDRHAMDAANYLATGLRPVCCDDERFREKPPPGEVTRFSWSRPMGPAFLNTPAQLAELKEACRQEGWLWIEASDDGGY